MVLRDNRRGGRTITIVLLYNVIPIRGVWVRDRSLFYFDILLASSGGQRATHRRRSHNMWAVVSISYSV